MKKKKDIYLPKIQNMNTPKSGKKEKDALMKRNNSAPDFPSTLILSRSQLIVERYLQEYAYNLEDYIKNRRILTVDIDIPTLRSWYPTKHWKKDLENTCLYMMNARKGNSTKGGFELYSLLTFAELDETGLHVNVDPTVLQKYIIASNVSTTDIDFGLQNKFKGVYTHEFYWLTCLNDQPCFGYKFSLTPEWINDKFGVNYQNSNIKAQIIIPSQEEMKKFYDNKLCPRYFTFEEIRQVVGKCTKIIRWEFTIHNENREDKRKIEANKAYREINKFLAEHLPKYRINILDQIRLFDTEHIIRIWMRLTKYVVSDKEQIRNRTAYLFYILEKYDVYPKRKNKASAPLISTPLFQKEEKDTAAGIRYWTECMRHIEESPNASREVKDLFKKLCFYTYVEDENENIITFQTSKDAYTSIETYFSKVFEEVLQRYFPSPLKVFYKTT